MTVGGWWGVWGERRYFLLFVGGKMVLSFSWNISNIFVSYSINLLCKNTLSKIDLEH